MHVYLRSLACFIFQVAESENIPAENDSELAAVTERLKADDDAHSSSSEDGDADTDRTASVMDEVNPTAKDCDPLSRIQDSGGDDGGDDRKDDNDDGEKCDKGEAEDGTALEEEGVDSDGFETEEEYTDDGEDTGSDCVEEAGDSVKSKDHVTPADDSHIGGENAVMLQGLLLTCWCCWRFCFFGLICGVFLRPVLHLFALKKKKKFLLQVTLPRSRSEAAVISQGICFSVLSVSDFGEVIIW